MYLVFLRLQPSSNLVILKVFFNLNGSVILFHDLVTLGLMELSLKIQRNAAEVVKSLLLTTEG